MKRTLYLKFLTGYLILGILGFILVSTLTNYMLQKQVLVSEARTLYTECTEIASSYAANYYDGSMELSELHSHLETISRYMNTKIKVTDVSGRIMIDSSDLSGFSTDKTIAGFDTSASCRSFAFLSCHHRLYSITLRRTSGSRFPIGR